MNLCSKFLNGFHDVPEYYPTHRHEPHFWECLGRAVATFGFMEEILCCAIFRLTDDKLYSEYQFNEWIAGLEKCLPDPLGKLIKKYEHAIEPKLSSKEECKTLIKELNKVKEWRDIICHGSWHEPDENGESTLWFAKRSGKGKDVETLIWDREKKISVADLLQVQKHTAELCIQIIQSSHFDP